jgi:aldehyde:ferredoxin oxidoreductase
MEKIIGTSNRVIEVSLTDQSVKTFQITEQDRRMYLGGKGLGLKFFSDRVRPGIDPLAPENLLIFMTGVMMGTGAPCSGRFAAVTKSPLTGIMLSSSCGGPFGMALKTAGYDGLIIGGKSESPVLIRIDAQGVRFDDASPLWGLDTVESQEQLDPGKKDGALVIGPAGENKVLFANVASGHRFLGRGGMGAVMGSKNLKAVIAHGGDYQIVPFDPAAFKKVKEKAVRQINANHFTGEAYRHYGTCANVNLSNRGGILPINNFRDGSHEMAIAVSGEEMQKRYNTRPSTCLPCTILCGHKGTYPDGSMHQIPEYETVSLLGTNLGIFDADRITEWNDLCGRLGIDTITTGATLAWTMEAGEKGLLTTSLKFGSADGVADAIRSIAYRREQGNELADGTRRLSEKYGGKTFAIHVKGLEMAGYDPRGSWGQGLSYAVANRGACHLSAVVFSLEVFMGFLNPYTSRAKARFVRFFESLFATVNSLHICQFTSFAYVLEEPVVKYTPKPILGFTMQYLPWLATRLIFFPVLTAMYASVTGTKLSQSDFLKAGDRIHTLERLMNTREGISRKDDTLPGRFLNEGRECDSRKRTVPLEAMLDTYYRIRGFDLDGIPKPETLKKLDTTTP